MAVCMLPSRHSVRVRCAQVTDSKLDEYYNTFRGSAGEEQELLQLFEQHEGDMDAVFEYLPCSEASKDSHRFMAALEGALREHKIVKTRKYSSWCVPTRPALMRVLPPAPALPAGTDTGSQRPNLGSCALMRPA